MAPSFEQVDGKRTLRATQRICGAPRIDRPSEQVRVDSAERLHVARRLASNGNFKEKEMYFVSQAAYEHYYSPEQRRLRSERAADHTKRAVSEALALFETGDAAAARQRLFDAGMQDEGISYYLRVWKS